MTNVDVILENPDTYLTKDLFYLIIGKHFVKQPFTIIHFENVDAIKLGENFAPKIIKNLVRTQLNDGTKREFQFISKISGSLLHDESVIDRMNVFPKEIGMYEDIIPEFERLWRKLANTNISFGPKLYYAELKPRKILIFDNLYDMGYHVADKFSGLSKDHILLVLEKISKWHAVSRIYYENHKPIDSMLARGIVHSGATDNMATYHNLMYVNFMEVLEKTDIDETYLEMIRNWKDKIVPNLLNAAKCDPCGFNVLNHGDLWTNNMMFRDDGLGNVTEVKFLDYQMGNYGSPVLDLLHFFVASVRYDVLADQFDDFVAYYHRQLVIALKQLNLTRIPTLKEIHIEMLSKSFYSVVMLLGGLQTVLIDYQNDKIDLSKSAQDNQTGYVVRKKMMENPRVLYNVLGLLKFFGSRGMLDS